MTANAAPIKPLLVLSLAVLLAHLFVLNNASAQLNYSPSLTTRPFITRTIELAAAPERPAPAPAAVMRKKQSSHRPAPPAKTQPVPRPAAPPEVPLAALPPESSTPPVLAAPAPPAAIPPAAPSPTPIASDREMAANPPAPPTRPPRDSLPHAKTYALPGSARLKYDVAGQVRGLPYSVQAELLWLHDGKTYDARLEVSAFLLGSRIQTSAGRITADGLAPTRFSDKARSELAAHFERDKGKITFSANTPDAPLLAGAQDRLSIFVQLGAMIAGAPAKYPRATTIAMQTVSARDADTWLFSVDGEEKLNLPGGEQTALKLVRLPQPGYDQKVELWLAPALGYLPVRIRLTQANGDFVDQQWRATEAP